MLALFKGVNKIKWAKVSRIRENKKIKDERINNKEKTNTERWSDKNNKKLEQGGPGIENKNNERSQKSIKFKIQLCLKL